jgi:hypothetical protein
MSDKKSGPKELNLGLTALLARATADGAAPGFAGDVSPQPETAIVTLEDDIQTLNAELSRLAESGEWGMLVGRAESAITSEEDIEARLWWIRGHLGAFTLPVSLLAAPFETVCRQLVGDSRVDIFAELIREIGEIAVVRLHDVGDRRQEHAVRLALCKLGILDAAEMSRKSYGKIPPKAPRFELGTVSVEKPAVPAALSQPARKETWRVAALSIALLCLVLIGVFLIRARVAVQQPLMTAPEDLLVMNEVPGMVPPDVVGRPVSSSLGALYYSLERDSGDVSRSSAPPGSARTEDKRDARKAEGSRVVTDSAQDQVSARAAQSERPSAPDEQKPREVVRTDGPIEGPDFARGFERQRVPQPRLPDVMPPINRKPLSNLSYPDGSINLGGEIKLTLVRTDVLDSPSYQGRTIARLEPGDKVSVEGRVGQWLRIRSQRGRAGFVYAQDVGELENFNVESAPQ